MPIEPETRKKILAAAKEVLLEVGYAHLSTRRIAEVAGVPLSQIHYHFGSKQNLLLAVLEDENRRLLERQGSMFERDLPLWKRWMQSCDYLEDDLESGYVRVLQEMIAAGWSDTEISGAVRDYLRGWFDLLTNVADAASERVGGLGPLPSRESATLTGLAFLGAEQMILLGFPESILPSRAALRGVGELLRALEEPDAS